MSFRLFGIPVEIQVGFWITAVLLGWQRLNEPQTLLTWVAVVFFSILVHELGHAFAIRRHGIEPEIALVWLGGRTSWRPILPISRPHKVIISLAGPFAGFALGGAVYALYYFAPEIEAAAPKRLIWDLISVNLGWGLINLLPVLPLDGGHVLEDALGPKRERLAVTISIAAAVAVVIYALRTNELWIAFIFGMSAMQSFQRLRLTPSDPIGRIDEIPRARVVKAPSLPPEVLQLVQRARRALAEDRPDEAVRLAEQILRGQADDGSLSPPPAAAAHAALEVIAWARFSRGDMEAAWEALRSARRIDTVDAALEGSLLFAQGQLAEARKILEAARAKGDMRKEVAAVLIQVLLGQGEVPRGSAIALDIADSMSDDDLRKMGSIAYEAGAFDWAARLYEAIFTREGDANDAYEAARAHAQRGDRARALSLLRSAVKAGFSDRARASSDAALDAVRADLDAVLPSAHGAA